MVPMVPIMYMVHMVLINGVVHTVHYDAYGISLIVVKCSIPMFTSMYLIFCVAIYSLYFQKFRLEL